jgi:hypothetical protein
MGVPLYDLVINEEDETGVTAVALVDEPAIQLNWLAFSTQKQLFKTLDQEKRIISGPLMVADMVIPRRDDIKGEYNVRFNAKTIEQIANKFHKNGYEKNVNPMHKSMALLPDIYMVSDFRIDSARGIMTPKGYDELPDGTWFADFKVNNDQIWNEYIKTGLFKGFSVEGFFNEVMVGETKDSQEMLEIAEVFLALFSNNGIYS